MKIYTKFIILIVGLTALFTACRDSEWSDLPSGVSDFISEYYPEQTISSQEWKDGVYYVRMKSGEVITFDKDLKWRSLNGYGATLPQMFLFDCLPPALYEYLQSIESVNEVYRVERTLRDYIVETKNATVVYDIATGNVSQPVQGQQLVKLLLS